MAYFEWADDMVIDNGPIDKDHQILVRQVNELHTATSEGRGHEVVGRLLDELIRDTVEHIRREEQEMARMGYPRLVQHKQGHDQFVADLQACSASSRAAAAPWPRNCLPCCGTGCRCTSGAMTKTC